MHSSYPTFVLHALPIASWKVKPGRPARSPSLYRLSYLKIKYAISPCIFIECKTFIEIRYSFSFKYYRGLIYCYWSEIILIKQNNNKNGVCINHCLYLASLVFLSSPRNPSRHPIKHRGACLPASSTAVGILISVTSSTNCATFLTVSRDSSVRLMTGLRVYGHQGAFPILNRDFFLLFNSQTGYGVQAAFYPVGTGFSRG
jgi:hypothetical protein